MRTGKVLEEGEAPETIKPVERYLRDLVVCLQELTSGANPPKQLYRAAWQTAYFVVGDASRTWNGG